MLVNSLKSLRSLVLLVGAAGGLLGAGAAMAAEEAANFSDSGWVQVDGVWYPYCTNSGDNGGGFGWQPELGGPNGGSCKINYNSNGGNGGYSNPGYPSGTWYDGNGVAYPYCTNSGDNGGGFGWQPELGGPNGGSCKINYNGGNGGYNGGGNGGYNGGGNGGWHDDRGGWHDNRGGWNDRGGRRGGPVDVRVGRGGVGVRVGPVGVRVGRGGIGVRIGRVAAENTSPVEE